MKVKYRPTGRGRRAANLTAGAEYELLSEFTDADQEHYVLLEVAIGGKKWGVRVLAENVEFTEDQPELQPAATTGVAGTLEQRKRTHGEFTHVADTTQNLLALAHAAPNWGKLANTQKEALHMSFSKIARILNGNSNHNDNWHDIAGYATLAEQAL